MLTGVLRTACAYVLLRRENGAVGSTAILSVSFNTKKLTALLLWSLHRVLDPADLSIVIVDNASTDGSAELLDGAQRVGLCTLIRNSSNVGHGQGLNAAMQSEPAQTADQVWVLDSDCVVTRPDALTEPLARHPDADIIGEAHWDPWHERERCELYSLIIRRSALDRHDVGGFTEGGDPSWDMLTSAERAGLTVGSFPFTADGFVVHLGRASLAAVVATGDTSNPLFRWATHHRDPHFGGVEGARERHATVVSRFISEVGPGLDLEVLAR
jgi:hypothetical protein